MHAKTILLALMMSALASPLANADSSRAPAVGGGPVESGRTDVAEGGAGGAASGQPLHGFSLESSAAERDLERRFDSSLDAGDQRSWLETMASAPNHVSSPHDKLNAEFMLAKFREWGWDARIETFQVLYPVPKSVSLEMTAPTSYKAALREQQIDGDKTSNQVDAELPPYNAYGADGDVTAELVYVNYGMDDDYKTLARNGVSVKGKIVITRYGAGWRGLKPKLAQEHGAIGCIIYSDPADDGYGPNDTYPNGPTRPEQGVQRGSVADMPVRAGDPLTPDHGATEGASRLSIKQSEMILKIPVLPISYGDARHLLAAMKGPVAPKSWRGALPITYHIGPGASVVHLAIQSDWSLKPVYDVVATIQGSQYPDQWVVRGNHHDGWVFGAHDPLSGNVALMSEMKALGALAKSGWRPKRTIVYASWDGEEPGLLGSTEWGEQHAQELQAKAVLYVNSDSNSRGFLSVDGSHSYQHLVNEVAAELIDPETGATVSDRLRANIETAALEKGASEDAKKAAELAGKGGDIAIDPLGSGSDYTVYEDHLGIASLNVGYDGEGELGGVYHSAYDSYDHFIRFADPKLAYGVLLSQTIGRLVLRAANADLVPYRFSDFADTMGRYVEELHKLEGDKRERAETLQRLMREGAYRLAADPTETNLPPEAEDAVPHLELAALDNAVDTLKASAKAFDAAAAQAVASGGLSGARLAALNAYLQGQEQALLDKAGLPGRPWFKNLVYAPGLFTGYAPKTLAGVREGIEQRHWAQANTYSVRTAQALEAYARRLDHAATMIKGTVASR